MLKKQVELPNIVVYSQASFHPYILRNKYAFRTIATIISIRV